VLIFLGLLNICLTSDLYQPQQKQLLLSWKQKIGSIWHTLPATFQTPQSNQKSPTSWHNPSSLSRRSSLQNWHKFSPDHGGRPVQCPSSGRENLAFLPFQDNSIVQQRSKDPNLKFSSSYPSGINTRSGSLVTNTRQLAYPAEFSQYKACIARAAAGSDYGDSEHFGDKYSPGADGGRKKQLAETELDTRMESLCLSVTEHALGLDK
jgi:hypothetical protein